MHARFHRFLNWGEAYSEYRAREIEVFGGVWCTDWGENPPNPKLRLQLCQALAVACPTGVVKPTGGDQYSPTAEPFR